MAENKKDDWEDIPVEDWQDESVAEFSAPETIALKGAQGASFNLMDELIGAKEGIGNALTGETSVLDTDKDLLDRLRSRFTEGYEGGRDRMRAIEKQMQEERPALSMASEIGGGLATALLPGGAVAQATKKAPLLTRLAKGAAVGGGYAGLAGAGASEGETLQEVGADTVKSAIIGSTIGGAIPLAGAAAKKAIIEPTKWVGKKLSETNFAKRLKAAEDFLDEGFDLTKETDQKRFFETTGEEIKTAILGLQAKAKSLMDDRATKLAEADIKGVRFSLKVVEDALVKAKKSLANPDLDSATKTKLQAFVTDMENIVQGPEIDVVKTVLKPGKTYKSTEETRQALIKNYEKKVQAGLAEQGQLAKSYPEITDDISGKKELYALYDSPQPGTQTGSKLLGKYQDVPKAYSEVIPEEVVTKGRAGAPQELTPTRAAEIRKIYTEKAKYDADKTGKTEELYKDVTEGMQGLIKSTEAGKPIEQLNELGQALKSLNVPNADDVVFKASNDPLAGANELYDATYNAMRKMIREGTVDQIALDRALDQIAKVDSTIGSQLKRESERLLMANRLGAEELPRTVTPSFLAKYAAQSPAWAAKATTGAKKAMASSYIQQPKKLVDSLTRLNTAPVRGRVIGEVTPEESEPSEFKKSSDLVNVPSEKLMNSLRNVNLTESENKLIKKLLEMKPGQERAVALKNFSDQSQQNRELLRKLGLMGEVK